MDPSTSEASAASSCHKATLRNAKSSSGPGSLSETRMLPSPAAVVPPSGPLRSTTSTRRPVAASAAAVAAPTIPAPITTTSAERGIKSVKLVSIGDRPRASYG